MRMIGMLEYGNDGMLGRKGLTSRRTAEPDGRGLTLRVVASGTVKNECINKRRDYFLCL